MCDSQAQSVSALLLGGGISFGFFLLGLLAGEPLRIWLNRGEGAKQARLAERVAGIKKLRKRILDAQVAIAKLLSGMLTDSETEFASAAKAGLAMIDLGYVFTHYRRVISTELTAALDVCVRQSAVISSEMKSTRDGAKPEKPSSLDPNTKSAFGTLYEALEQALDLANNEYALVLGGK